MEVSASLIKELRERTGAGIMECKKALIESECDLEKAADYLREKGLAKVAKREGKVASEGLVVSYIHGGGKIGVLVEVNCETDFVARNEDFALLVKDIAMHIAAMNPLCIKRSDIPADVVEKEKEIFRAQARESGKPEGMVEKIAEGKLEKFYKEASLLEQPFVKDPDKTVETLINDAMAKIGEKVSVRRFARYKVGEGIEKKSEDFSKEVAATVGR